MIRYSVGDIVIVRGKHLAQVMWSDGETLLWRNYDASRHRLIGGTKSSVITDVRLASPREVQLAARLTTRPKV